ncbi:MAG: phosphatase [Ruminiclostridium sp.]|nr:phosphatase [Ruminococcus sp.]MBR1433030.1 phosphatase [Ruminococcus sp.]MBR1831063.1 phosphatase [Ruminiclostridium sp.]
MLSEEERAAIEARREYYRKWRAANKDKVNAINERYWVKKGLQAAGNTGGDK